jgi:hypothetical protein
MKASRKDDMGAACGAYWERRDAYTVLVGNMKKREHLENVDVDGTMILQWMLKKWVGGMDWIGLV